MTALVPIPLLLYLSWRGPSDTEPFLAQATMPSMEGHWPQLGFHPVGQTCTLPEHNPVCLLLAPALSTCYFWNVPCPSSPSTSFTHFLSFPVYKPQGSGGGYSMPTGFGRKWGRGICPSKRKHMSASSKSAWRGRKTEDKLGEKVHREEYSTDSSHNRWERSITGEKSRGADVIATFIWS